jgi:uncharacterized surface protein with fasciclin (FAS1) repeats
MIKKVFGLFVALSFVLILAACKEPSAIQKSFEEQSLDYSIHLKALTYSGYLSTADSSHSYTAQSDSDPRPGSYNGNRIIFAYTNQQYNELFLELGIKERDFYCLPMFDTFMKNTIFAAYHSGVSFPLYATPLVSPAQITDVPTLHGDRFTVGRYTQLGNGKFGGGSLHTNLDFEDFSNEQGMFTIEMYNKHIYEQYTYEEIDALILERAERTINLIDVVKYRYGYYIVPSEIFWPSGVELPAPGNYCSVSKLVEYETETSGFQGIISGAATLTELNGDNAYTIFAPTNSIIENKIKQDRDAFKTREFGNANDQIIRDHTVEGSYSFAELRDRAPFTLESLSGNKLRIVSDGTRVFVNGYELTNPDMAARNGFVHNIKGVLYDKNRGFGVGLIDVMNGVDDLSTWVDHIDVLGLETQLSTDEFTVLATTKKGYEAWLSASGLSKDNPLDHDIIIETILSQVIGGAYSKEQLLDITKNGPVQFETLVEDVFITISQDAGKALYADGILMPFNPRKASNGFVYEIDDVLIPQEPILIFDLISSLNEISRFDDLLDILAFNGIFLNGESYTFFTPLNDPILDWMIETSIDIYSPNAIDQVVAFVYAHTAAGVYTRQELLALSLNQPYNIESLIPNVSITITQDTEGKLYANGVLIVDSYDAINGAVHTLNGTIEPKVTNTLLDTLNLAGSFTIFIQLLEAVSLDNLLTQPTPMHSVVAPTNQAFENLMVELQIDLNNLLTLEGLENILKYHFIPGVVSMSNLNSLYNDELTSLNTLLNDRFIIIDKDLENQITLNGFNLYPIHGSVDNGYIYFIDTVLIPEPSEEEPVMGNLVEVLTEGGVFEILIQALQATGLNVLLTGEASYTVFSPLDGYFMVKMIQEEITLETLLADPGLLEFLRSHIVLGTWDADSLKALVLSGQNTIYTLNNTPLVITQEGDFLFINGKDIIVPNTFATNGVVHSMAGFLVEF